jgi:hypothetical protein
VRRDLPPPRVQQLPGLPALLLTSKQGADERGRPRIAAGLFVGSWARVMPVEDQAAALAAMGEPRVVH